MRSNSIASRPHKNPVLAGFGMLELLASMAVVTVSLAAISLLLTSSLKYSAKSPSSYKRYLTEQSWKISELSAACTNQAAGLEACTKFSGGKRITRYQLSDG